MPRNAFKNQRAGLVRVIEPSCRRQLDERLHGCRVKICNALQLVRYDQRALSRAVLRGDAGRAAIRMAALRLDAAQREHEPAGGIAPVGP
jgi:hypothetical protein